jgi:hypothetical protein
MIIRLVVMSWSFGLVSGLFEHFYKFHASRIVSSASTHHASFARKSASESCLACRVAGWEVVAIGSKRRNITCYMPLRF